MSTVDTATTTDTSIETEAPPVVADTPDFQAPPVEEAAVGEGQLYTVKVRGEETQVSLDELTKGYQRQQDYTRSKQELSHLRQELGQAEAIVRALEADPTRTLQALATAYDVKLDNRVDDYDTFGSEDDLDPESRRIQELESRLQAQEQSSIMQAIEREINDLESRFGSVDREALLDFAYRTNAPNLKMAYASMNFDDVFAQAGKRSEQQATDDQITDAKRVAGLMEGGSSNAAGSVTQAPQKINSVRDAWLAAKDQLSKS